MVRAEMHIKAYARLSMAESRRPSLVNGAWRSPRFGGGEADYLSAETKKDGAWGAPNWEGTQLTFKHGCAWPSSSIPTLSIYPLSQLNIRTIMTEGQSSTPATQPSGQAPQVPQKLSDVIRSYRPCKVLPKCAKHDSEPRLTLSLQLFRASKADNANFVTSLDFDDQGEYLVAAGDDETIQVFDIKEGKLTKNRAQQEV
jgi:hypothetical protein